MKIHNGYGFHSQEIHCQMQVKDLTESSTEYNKFLDMQSSFVGGTVVWTYIKHLIDDLFLSDENKTITK